MLETASPQLSALVHATVRMSGRGEKGGEGKVAAADLLFCVSCVGVGREHGADIFLNFYKNYWREINTVGGLPAPEECHNEKKKNSILFINIPFNHCNILNIRDSSRLHGCHVYASLIHSETKSK